MKVDRVILILLLFFGVGAQSQSGQRLMHFKVVADSVSTEGINVINLVNEQVAITDATGSFSILAQVDDLLVLTAVNFEYKRKIIEEQDLTPEVVLIKMVPKVTRLDEVVVNQYPHINPEQLGIVPKGQKKYTPAERRLYSAQTGPVDILANLISGRTKQLKKELKVSKKELLLAKMEFLYANEYYTDTLGIPLEHIKGFQFFVIEDAEFVAALKAKNKPMTMFHASKLATVYKGFINKP